MASLGMSIQLNGESYSWPEGQTVADLIEHLGLAGRRLAVELNRNILPRAQYATTLLKSNDCVEVVQAIGGG